MSVFITCNGNTYSDLKELTFAPEFDPTLESMPICQFGAEIVTTDAADTFKGKDAYLYENRFGTDKLLAGCYTVTEAEQIAPGVVRILVESLLKYLDSRVLPAKLYSWTDVDVFFQDIYAGETEEETETVRMWDEDEPPIRYVGPSGGIRIKGFFPRQTARERLRTYCQAEGYYVIQWGANTQYGLAVNNYQGRSLENNITLLPEETYKQPVVKRISDIGIVRIIGYNSHTTTYHSQEDGWEKYTIREGWSDPNTGLTQDEEAMYYRPYTQEYTINDGSDGIAEIKNNLSIMNSSSVLPYYLLPAVRMAFFTHYEVELDALCMLDASFTTKTAKMWYPGELIAFSIDDGGTYYCGMIKSADYTFRKMTRARLKIMTDMTPTATATVIIKYESSKSGLGPYTVFAQKKYVLPANAKLWYTIPEYIHAYDGDKPILLKYEGSVHIDYASAGAASTVTERTFTYTYTIQ